MVAVVGRSGATGVSWLWGASSARTTTADDRCPWLRLRIRAPSIRVCSGIQIGASTDPLLAGVVTVRVSTQHLQCLMGLVRRPNVQSLNETVQQLRSQNGGMYLLWGPLEVNAGS